MHPSVHLCTLRFLISACGEHPPLAQPLLSSFPPSSSPCISPFCLSVPRSLISLSFPLLCLSVCLPHPQTSVRPWCVCVMALTTFRAAEALVASYSPWGSTCPGSPRSGGESTTTPEGPQALVGALAGLTWRRELEALWHLHGQRDGTATAPSVNPGTLKSAVDDSGHVGGWVSRWEMARDAILAHVMVHTCMQKHAHMLPTRACPHCTCNPSGGLQTLGRCSSLSLWFGVKPFLRRAPGDTAYPPPGHCRPSAGLRGGF